MEEPTTKTEMEVLFPEIEVGSDRIRPWSWSQLVSVMPFVKRAIDLAREAGITEKLLNEVKEKPESLLTVIEIIGPIVPEIISRTLKVDVKDVEKWSPGEIFHVALVILIQNGESLKNSLGLVASQMAALKLGPRP